MQNLKEEMIMKKRTIALILSLVLALGLTGCAKGDSKADRGYTSEATTSNTYKSNNYATSDVATESEGYRYFEPAVTASVE